MDELNLKNKKSSDIKCTGCGGIMEFSPESGKLECLHCGNVLSFESDERVVKKPFENIEEEFQSWDKETILVRCINCGSKEVVSGKNIAHKCSFCGSSKMAETEDLPGLKPNGVLPFIVPEKQATANFMKWLKKKWFTPSDLKTSARINTFSGVYTPTWSYDSNTKTDYKGVLIRRETRKRGEHLETYIVNIPVKGKREDAFFDVLVPVGQKIDRVSFKRLEPFKFDELKIFSKNYLAGFTANHYSVNATEAWKSAMQYMKSDITNRIVRKHNADGVSYLNMDIKHNDTKYSYLLLPIWVCNYYYKQKLFNFFINGYTGKVTGKVPRSAIKIILFILFILALLAALPALGLTFNS
jgi:ribosomal protein S27E